mmetsp:Transcript_38647/g.85983  ORF Transcript_38647/g.85983 Transcript_38647/m.85983 type:complete len:523 (-) Transcript_38647:1004-2572(-)
MSDGRVDDDFVEEEVENDVSSPAQGEENQDAEEEGEEGVDGEEGEEAVEDDDHVSNASSRRRSGASAQGADGVNQDTGQDFEAEASPEQQEHDQNQEESQAEEGVNPDDLTKRYLRMLNTGRLASKRKSELQSKQLSPRGVPTISNDTAAEQQLRSVFESELSRLQASVQNLNVSPIRRNARPSSTRPGSGSSAPPLSRQQQQQQAAQERSQLRPGSPLHGALSQAPQGTSPFKKIYTPGPGAYTPATDRFGGRDGNKFSFGTSRQRPPHVCIQDAVVSPGPVYRPLVDSISNAYKIPQYSFGRQLLGSRFNLSASMPSNCPHWNPGPADYEVSSLYKGGNKDPGVDAPKTVFGRSQKLVSPETRFSATVFVSKEHAKRENLNIHSPGPAQYSPDVSPTRSASEAFSLGAKASSYFDVFLDPARQPSPGPIYNTSHMDRRGTRSWGCDPKATFGRANKLWEPEVNMSATTFISKEHAMRANQAVHSPGPIYFPQKVSHISTPSINSGPPDRFYNRFEPGRLA